VDEEGDGDAVCEGDDEAELDRDGLGDFGGRGDDGDCECADELVATRDGTVWTWVGTEAEG
jgi:hypothetical protein